MPNRCYTNEGASRYYTLPKGDLRVTTGKELTLFKTLGRTLSPDEVIVLLPWTIKFAGK